MIFKDEEAKFRSFPEHYTCFNENVFRNTILQDNMEEKSWEVGCGNTEDDACCDVSTGGNHDSSGGGGCCTDTDGCGNTSVVATPPSVWVSTDLLARPPVILSGTSRCLNWTEHSHSHFSVHFSYFNLSN